MPARRFLLVCLLVAAAAATGACSTTSSSGRQTPQTVWTSADVTAVDRPVASRCGQPLEVDDPLGALAAAVDELASAVDTERVATGCAVVAHPVCAALFLIGATDPIAAFGAALPIDDVDRLAELHHRVLVDGAEAARQHGDGELEEALRAVADLDLRAVVGRDDAATAAIAVARSDSAIVGPIAATESDCR